MSIRTDADRFIFADTKPTSDDHAGLDDGLLRLPSGRTTASTMACCCLPSSWTTASTMACCCLLSAWTTACCCLTEQPASAPKYRTAGRSRETLRARRIGNTLLDHAAA